MWMLALKYWKEIILGAIIAGLLVYVGILKIEVSSAKKEAQKWETTYVTYKTNVEGKIAALGSANSALTLQLKESNIARMKADKEARPKLIERITNDKASANIHIPAASVQLFNDAARSGSADLGQPPSTNRVDATNTGTSDDFNFQDIQIVHEHDSHELNLCRQSVIDWNTMWDGFTANVKATERVSTQ